MSERAKFVLKFGVLAWGVPMLVISLFIEHRFHNRPLSQAFFALLWLSGGALFGLMTWNSRSSQARNTEKSSTV